MDTWMYGLIGAASVVSAALFLVSVLQLVMILRKRFCKQELPVTHQKARKSVFTKGLIRGHVFRFTYQEIEAVSEGFSNLIGEGTTNLVYKGILGDGTEVAIKSIKKGIAESSDVDASFRFQVELLSRVHHQHLSNLIGFCDDKTHRMLIFQYAPNGSLFENLHGDEHLTWRQRMRIIVGAAYGLAYLHHSCNPPIIHGDFRSRNILLTEDNAAKMTGLGRVPVVVSSELAVVRKTGGYVDPDVVHRGVYSRAGDVYSFGVLLLEILTGKLAFSEETGMLVDWAGHFLQNRDRMMEIVDPTLKSATPLELYALCEIARLCVQRESSARPSMKTVLELLVQTLAIPAETAAPFNSPVTLRGLMEAYI